MGNPAPRVFSVGHSTLTLPSLLDLLAGAGVTAVADVRSAPYSRRLPQFNRGALKDGLRAAGVAYVYLGDLLGGRPGDEGLYDAEGRVDYEAVRRTAAFREGLRRLLEGAERYAVAMLCGEEDPLDCHRGLMITPALVEAGTWPLHIRKGGRLEPTAEMEGRLLALFPGLRDKTVQRDLYSPLPDRAAVLAEAYRAQARKKAFRRTEGDDGL
jgi:uncharacterized protein (DUF488 family)